jgi:hypothetical protein
LTIAPTQADKVKFHREDNKTSAMVRVAVSFEYNGKREKISTSDAYKDPYEASRGLLEGMCNCNSFGLVRTTL